MPAKARQLAMNTKLAHPLMINIICQGIILMKGEATARRKPG